ncbi:unnamed protein product [Caenorhabditis angaria]|uniref:Uncharacterized protein n=1 Tax=Caenorhabditis angaria TaxID=860376 RepID=A0A9P1IIA9_9PELO|nr:unnamed protein product [Caenorhabditis angaria]
MIFWKTRKIGCVIKKKFGIVCKYQEILEENVKHVMVIRDETEKEEQVHQDIDKLVNPHEHRDYWEKKKAEEKAEKERIDRENGKNSCVRSFENARKKMCSAEYDLIEFLVRFSKVPENQEKKVREKLAQNFTFVNYTRDGQSVVLNKTIFLKELASVLYNSEWRNWILGYETNHKKTKCLVLTFRDGSENFSFLYLMVEFRTDKSLKITEAKIENQNYLNYNDPNIDYIINWTMLKRHSNPKV